MNRREFLSSLITELRNVEPTELQDVLQYYNEYFDEAGVEKEETVIAELGSPQHVASQIRATAAIKYLESQPSNSKKSFKAVWIAIGTIFAAPIALPITLALAIVAIALILVLFAVLLALFVSGFAAGVTGVVAVICSFALLPASFPTFLVAFGTGLAALGIATLIFVPTLMLWRFCFSKIALLLNKAILKKNKVPFTPPTAAQ